MVLENILGSKLRAKALSWLFTHRNENYYVRQLTALLDVDSTNLSRELARLANAGILVMNRKGRQKYYQANPVSPLFAPLTALIVASNDTEVNESNSMNGISLPQKKLKEFCKTNDIRKLSLFGSVLRDDFTPESDIDVLAEFEPGKAPGYLGLAGMEEELSTILGRCKVDLRTPEDLSRYFRKRVLREAQIICP